MKSTANKDILNKINNERSCIGVDDIRKEWNEYHQCCDIEVIPFDKWLDNNFVEVMPEKYLSKKEYLEICWELRNFNGVRANFNIFRETEKNSIEYFYPALTLEEAECWVDYISENGYKGNPIPSRLKTPRLFSGRDRIRLNRGDGKFFALELNQKKKTEVVK
jgi:hypothetical protein